MKKKNSITSIAIILCAALVWLFYARTMHDSRIVYSRIVGTSQQPREGGIVLVKNIAWIVTQNTLVHYDVSTRTNIHTITLPVDFRNATITDASPARAVVQNQETGRYAVIDESGSITVLDLKIAATTLFNSSSAITQEINEDGTNALSLVTFNPFHSQLITTWQEAVPVNVYPLSDQVALIFANPSEAENASVYELNITNSTLTEKYPMLGYSLSVTSDLRYLIYDSFDSALATKTFMRDLASGEITPLSNTLALNLPIYATAVNYVGIVDAKALRIGVFSPSTFITHKKTYAHVLAFGYDGGDTVFVATPSGIQREKVSNEKN